MPVEHRRRHAPSSQPVSESTAERLHAQRRESEPGRSTDRDPDPLPLRELRTFPPHPDGATQRGAQETCERARPDTCRAKLAQLCSRPKRQADRLDGLTRRDPRRLDALRSHARRHVRRVEVPELAACHPPLGRPSPPTPYISLVSGRRRRRRGRGRHRPRRRLRWQHAVEVGRRRRSSRSHCARSPA